MNAEKELRQHCLADGAPAAQQIEAGDSARICCAGLGADETDAPAGEWEMAES